MRHLFRSLSISAALKTVLSIFFWLAIVTPCMVSSLSAQVLYGSLVGNVTDPSGGAVADASVEIMDPATNTVKRVTTNSSGTFQFTDLAPATYTLSVNAKSFGQVREVGILIQTNNERRVDVHLEVASVGQTVTVTTAPPVLQTEEASVSSELQSAQLENLPGGPNAGMRNFQSLYTIVPGFSPPSASHSEAGNPGDTLASNVNGVSQTNNNTRIDGVSDIYPWLPEIAAYAPSTDAIASVNIVTNSFDAEQGLAAGAAINVTTKSGTNRFHGTAWEYNTISALQAKPYYLPLTSRKPKYIMNQFGANFGGPILKDKAFFFANWERSRRAQLFSGFQTIATDAMRTGNFQGTGTTIYDPLTGNADGTGRTAFPDNIIPANRISYAAKQMISLLPETNVVTPNQGLTNNYFATAGGEYTRDNIDTRIDYTPSRKSTVFGRYGIQRTNIFDPQALGKAGGNVLDGGQPGNAPSTIHAVGLGGTYTFTPNVLLDINTGYLRQVVSAKNIDINQNYGLDFLHIPGTNGTNPLQGGYPGIAISSMSSLGNPNSSNPFIFKDNTYTTTANLTWIEGKHSLRFGAEYQHYALNHFQPNIASGARGGFSFTGGVTTLNGAQQTSNGSKPQSNIGYNAWADFLLGLPQSFGKDTEFLNPAALRESIWAFYARDQWQATDHLTLSYGLRYEIYPMATRDHTGPDIYNPANGNVYIGGVNGVPEKAGIDTGHGSFGPRFGVAYRIGDKTVIRAGYGMSVNPDNYRSILVAYPTVISQTISGANSYQPGGSTVTGIPAVSLPDVSLGILPLPPTLNITTFPRTYRRGYIESYNLAFQREIGAGVTLQATYVGTLSIREVVALNINAAGPGGGNAGRALYSTTKSTATIAQETPMGTANYNGLQIVAKRQFKGGGTFGLNYTYAKGINDYGNNTGIGPMVNYLPDYYRNRGVSGFDQTHNLEAYTNYMLPFGKGHSFAPGGIAGLLVSGWATNAILSRTSGTPFTITAAATSLNAPGNSQFANQIVRKVHILGGHDLHHPYFDTTNFTDPNKAASGNPVAFGTAGINSVRGPGYFNLSTSLARTFAFTDRFKLQIRGEAFNLTNTPYFGNPGANISTADSFGIISSASNSRALRLSARFDF